MVITKTTTTNKNDNIGYQRIFNCAEGVVVLIFPRALSLTAKNSLKIHGGDVLIT